MKKERFNLADLNVSSFKTSKLHKAKGGTGTETIDYTACYGDRNCQFYNTNNCGTVHDC